MRGPAGRQRPYRAIALISSLFLPLLSIGAAGQDLMLQYDHASGEVTFHRFYIDGKTYQTADLSVGYGRRVVVRAVNLNQNVYLVNSRSNGRPIVAPTSAGSLTSLLRPDPLAPLTELVRRDEPPAVTGRGGGRIVAQQPQRSPRQASGDDPVVRTVRTLLATIDRREGAYRLELSRFRSSLDAALQKAAPLLGLLAETAEMRGVTESAVKSRASELLAGVLDGAPPKGGYAVSDILRYSAASYTKMRAGYEELDRLFRELEGSYDQLDAITNEYPVARGLQIGPTDSSGFFLPLTEWLQGSSRARVREEHTASERLLARVREGWTDYFERVAAAYGAILDLPFTYQVETIARGDMVDITFQISDRGAAAERLRGDPPRVVVERHYRLPVSGGWKVNAGIGATAATFLTNQPSYAIAADTITRRTVDRFTPGVAAMLHLYQRSAGPVAFGASLGVGLSLSDERGFNILLGFGTTIGEEQRVTATLGLLGGQIQRLAAGWREGDRVTSGQLPLERGFDLGLYLGATWNLFGINDPLP